MAMLDAIFHIKLYESHLWYVHYFDTIISAELFILYMGYLANHLATVVCAIFASVLSSLWFVMVPMFSVLEFVFIMAVPIMWFLVAICWLAQKSADYAHLHPVKPTRAIRTYTSSGKLAQIQK